MVRWRNGHYIIRNTDKSVGDNNCIICRNSSQQQEIVSRNVTFVVLTILTYSNKRVEIHAFHRKAK